MSDKSKRGRTGRSVSVYLDNDVADALERLAIKDERRQGKLISMGMREKLGLRPKLGES